MEVKRMKAYRFYSDPNKLVSDGNTGLPLFRFDVNGEYVTLDPILAKRIGVRFECQEIELVEVKEPAQEQAEEVGDDAQVSSFLCPHCDFEAASKGGLSAHIRAKHKEE
jgi:hypothetical protein